MQEYVITHEEEKLLSDTFVQNLPVSIAEKRLYRKSISVCVKRKPFYTQFLNFVQKKSENFLSFFDFWHESLNVIEGLHGAAIVSYFVFIRWLLYMNIVIFLLNFVFLVLPQIVTPHTGVTLVNHTLSYFTQANIDDSLTKIYDWNFGQFQEFNSIKLHENTDFFTDVINNTSFETVVEYCQALYAKLISNDSRSDFIAVIQSFLQGTGPLEPTLLFIGFYPPYNIHPHGHVYYTSLAFLCVLLSSFTACFFMMAQYSTLGVQEAFTVHSKRSNFYTNEVFSAWEYCIKEPESAAHLHHEIVFHLKTALNEDRSARVITERSTKAWLKLYSVRFFINIFLLLWLISCCYIIYFVAVYQMKEQQEHTLSDPGFRTFFLQFLPSLTLIILNSISPVMFKSFVTFEQYSAQVESNLTIFRNLFLYLSSIMILLNTFYNQVACKAKDLCGAGLDATCRSPMCWETYIGQQLYKLTITKIFVLIGVFLCSDVLKYLVSQKWNNRCTKLMGVPAFSLPSEVLAVINSQTILWLGVFYSPLLPAVMIFKLIVMFNLRKVKVLKFCALQESSYRASKINTIFAFIMLISFFVVMIVQLYAIDSISPSRGCGPFRYYRRMLETMPVEIQSWLSILMSHWVLVFMLFILL